MEAAEYLRTCERSKEKRELFEKVFSLFKNFWRAYNSLVMYLQKEKWQELNEKEKWQELNEAERIWIKDMLVVIKMVFEQIEDSL